MKRILVVKTSSLGDLAHALPAVRALKARTGAAIDWVAQPEYAALLAAVPDVERVVAFPRRSLARDGAAFVRELRRETYDAAVDLQGLMKSALAARLARLARGGRRYGPAWAREGAHWLYDRQPARRPGPRAHAVDELLDVVDLVAPDGGAAVAQAPPEFREAVADDRPGPRVALAPFSRWSTKDWPAEKFAELGRRLATEMGCNLYVVGGPGDLAQGEALASMIGDRARNWCGRTDLPGLCGLLKGMDLLVSVDSGPMHWADAMGVPLVAVFGATDPARTGPYHQLDHVVVQPNLPCRPCHSRTCARGDLACLRTLDAQAVLDVAMRRL
jgi:heptosyltransferase I